MLKLLKIKNFALLEDLTIDFDNGLTVVTGETGAGKSMIVGAIATLCGSRMEDVLIRSKKNFAEVTGVFSVSPPFAERLKNAGLEVDSEIIVRRKLERGKRQATYINDQMISLNLLKDLARESVDLIGQYENQSLFYPRNHRLLLDSYGAHDKAVCEYALQYHAYRDLESQLEKLLEKISKKDDRIDYLTYQIKEIESAKIQEGEQQALELERDLLTTSEKRTTLSGAVIDHLYENEGSVIEQLSKVQTLIDELSKFDPKLAGQKKNLVTLVTSIEEMHRDISTYNSAIEFSAERLDEVQSRLEIIKGIHKKYGATVEDVIHQLDAMRRELRDLETRDEQIHTLKETLAKQKQQVEKQAERLHKQRQNAACLLEKEIIAKLTQLGMKKARFEIRITPCEMNEYGKDDVEFFISTNPGEELKPLCKVASGGEVSRITLTLKTILSAVDRIPTVIFDEVDTGIGGRIAEAVGALLAEVSKKHQIICITHLPQISVFANHHMLVEKEIKGKETFTRVTKLDEETRKQEIARMLAGKEITPKTMEYAAEFLKKRKT